MRLARSHVVLLSAGFLVAILLAIVLWFTAPVPPEPGPARAHAAGDPADPRATSDVDERRAVRPTEPASRESGAAADEAPSSTSDRIEGRVLRQDGLPAPAGTRVIARRRGKVRVDPEILERALIGDPSVLTASTRQDGRFVLERLEPGAEYLLCAVGGGYVGKTTDFQVRTGTTDAEIRVLRLYGVAVRLRETGGGAVRTEADLAPRPARNFGRADPYLDPSLLEFVGADLARYRDEPGEKLLLYTANGDPPMLRDLVLRFHPPGYAPAEITLDVPPILPAIAERSIDLESRAAGWGEIVIDFVGGPDPTVDAPLVQAFQVSLAPTDASSPQDVVRFDLPRGPGEKRVRGIPFGRYELSLRNAIRQTFLPAPGEPPIAVEVGADAVVVPVSLAGKAEVEIVFEATESDGYSGPATLSLPSGRLEPELVKHLAFGGQVLFDRGPYFLRALLPGSYTLFLEDPAGSVVGSEARHAFLELEPGSSTKVRLVLP